MKINTASASQWVSLGHPDKMADYIACYLLDRHVQIDPKTRFAVEVMIKDRVVVLGGQLTSRARFTPRELGDFVRAAVAEIGYTKDYAEQWGAGNTVFSDQLQVSCMIGAQSPDIGQGVDRDAWGDQGIFWGMAVDSPDIGYMPIDYWLARKTGRGLAESGIGGLDVKTLVQTDDGVPVKVTIAVPLLDEKAQKKALEFVKASSGCDSVILNGTGRYIRHSSMADCGVTGRKLAVDFYGGNCRIGGGSPWTKDYTKADLTLNIHARKLALDYMKANGLPACYVSLACSIGSPEVRAVFRGPAGEPLQCSVIQARPSVLAEQYGLNKARFTELCREGLFSRVG